MQKSAQTCIAFLGHVLDQDGPTQLEVYGHVLLGYSSKYPDVIYVAWQAVVLDFTMQKHLRVYCNNKLSKLYIMPMIGMQYCGHAIH